MSNKKLVWDSSVRESRRLAIMKALRDVGEFAGILKDERGIPIALFIPASHQKFDEACFTLGASSPHEILSLESVRRFLSENFFHVSGVGAGITTYTLGEVYTWFLIWSKEQLALTDVSVTEEQFEIYLQSNAVIVRAGQVRGIIAKEVAIREELLEP